MKTWLLGLSLFATSAWASSLEYNVRCDISEPTVKLAVDSDPRQILVCHEKAGEVHLGFSRPLTVSIGNQTYTAVSDWKSIEKKCSDAIKTYEKFPDALLFDTQTDTHLLVYFSEDFSRITVNMALKKDGCIGKRVN